eukprot:scaffold16723_cov143-Isochrysis_galbana.AAC.7
MTPRGVGPSSPYNHTSHHSTPAVALSHSTHYSRNRCASCRASTSFTRHASPRGSTPTSTAPAPALCASEIP